MGEGDSPSYDRALHNIIINIHHNIIMHEWYIHRAVIKVVIIILLFPIINYAVTIDGNSTHFTNNFYILCKCWN